LGSGAERLFGEPALGLLAFGLLAVDQNAARLVGEAAPGLRRAQVAFAHVVEDRHFRFRGRFARAGIVEFERLAHAGTPALEMETPPPASPPLLAACGQGRM